MNPLEVIYSRSPLVKVEFDASAQNYWRVQIIDSIFLTDDYRKQQKFKGERRFSEFEAADGFAKAWVAQFDAMRKYEFNKGRERELEDELKYLRERTQEEKAVRVQALINCLDNTTIK